MLWYEPVTKSAWYSQWTPEDEREGDPEPSDAVTMDDILSVGKVAVQNGYYNVSSSSKSKSMYYARGPRPPGKGRAPTEMTLRVSDHEPTYMQSAEAVNVVLYKDQPPPPAGNSIYAKAGDIASIQDAFRKADAEIRSRSGSPVMAWVSGNCRMAALEIEDITEEGLSVERKVGPKDVDPEELAMGIEVEHEHTDKDELAEKISLDHLAEIPDYYTRLKEMEEQADAEGKKASVQVIVKVADFNPPKPRKAVNITWKNPNLPADPYYLIGEVNSGRDARGNVTWDAPGSRGRSGEPKTIHSSDVQGWGAYSGPLYDWHKEENQREEQARYERENKSKIEAFKAANRFQDGRPLTPNMFLTVKQEAPGDLGMFAGRRLRVESIDHDAGTVSLRPFGWDEPEFEQFLKAIPVADVMSGTEPSMARAVETNPLRMSNGKTVLERDLPAMTPHFGLALENGQVTATVRVYGNYESKEMIGEKRYLHDMAERGYEPGEGGYALDTTPKQYKPDGSPANLFGPYSAHIKIAPPVSQELIEEVKALAPASTVKGGPQGLVLDSKPLFMLMIDSGHHDKVGIQRAADEID